MAYTYQIIFDGAKGRFIIDGDQLDAASELVPAGAYAVTVRAVHPDGWEKTKKFNIDILADPEHKLFSRSSAGVYSAGVLIRTLWSEEPFEGLINASLWDGLDDNGNIAPSGDYTIKILDTSGVEDEWAGAVGNNTYPYPWFQNTDQMHGMAITDTGKIYMVIGYWEGRTGTLKSTVADPKTIEAVLPVTYRFTGPVARHVATDNVRAYFAGDNVGTPSGINYINTSFVWAVTVADDVAHTFSSGAGVLKGGVTYSGASVLVSSDGVFPTDPKNYYGSGLITGLAVQKTGDLLFVTRQLLGNMYVLHKTTGALIAIITSLTEPTRICVDHNDDLWVVSKSAGAWIVAKYAVDSGTGVITLVTGSKLTGFASPLALSVTPDGATLRVADGGTSQQIKSYSNSTYALSGTYGQAGGYASSPDVTVDKFQFYHDCFITWATTTGGWIGGTAWTYLAHQPDGKLWVGDPSNARNMRFSIAGSAYTYVDEIAWVPLNYATSIDSNNANRVFADWREYAIDYTKTFPEEGFWTLVKNWKFNAPAATHDDQYTRMNRTTTLSNGRTYCLLRSKSVGVEIAELTSTGLRLTGVTDTSFVSCTLMPNGDLHYVNVANVGSPNVFQKRLLTGFDNSGNPTYGPKTTYLTTVNRAIEDPAAAPVVFPQPWKQTPNDTIAIYDPRKAHTGWHIAGVDATTGQWKFKTLPSVPANRNRWTDSVTKRFQDEDNWPKNYFDITPISSAGNIMYTIGSSFIAGYHGEGFGAVQCNKWWHYHESGLVVSTFGVVQIGEGLGQLGFAGNSGRGGGVAMQDENIILIHNDEFHGGCAHMWRIKNANSAHLFEEQIVWNSASYVKPAADPHDLLSGLTYNAQELANSTAGWTRSPTTNTITRNSATNPFWVVSTNSFNYDRRAGHVERPSDTIYPDIYAGSLQTAPAVNYVERTLPIGLGSIWRLESEILVAGCDKGANTASPQIQHMRVELLDSANKVIARFNVNETPSSSIWKVFGNNTQIASYNNNEEFWAATRLFNDLAIRSDGRGNILFAYANYPEIGTLPIDGTADWAAPAKFKITFTFVASGVTGMSINFRKLRID